MNIQHPQVSTVWEQQLWTELEYQIGLKSIVHNFGLNMAQLITAVSMTSIKINIFSLLIRFILVKSAGEGHKEIKKKQKKKSF